MTHAATQLLHICSWATSSVTEGAEAGSMGWQPSPCINRMKMSLPGHIGGEPSEFLMVQRGSWWEGDLAYTAAAAGAMFG